MDKITIELSVEEQKTFNKYAKLYGMSLPTLFKKALEEKIEDEIDMKSIQEYEEKVKNGSVKVYGHDEVKRMLSL